MLKPPRILRRYGHKGQFVRFPSDWDYRMVHTGRRRNVTHCDLLVGVCACGEHHFEDTDWVMERLSRYNAVIETHAEWVERNSAPELDANEQDE